MQFGNLALADRQQRHAVEDELLEQRRHMLLIARQTIEAFGDDDVEMLLARVRKKRLVAGAQMRRAARAVVGIDAAEPPAFRFDAAAADAHLILDRGVALKLRGIAGVNDGAHCILIPVRGCRR